MDQLLRMIFITDIERSGLNRIKKTLNIRLGKQISFGTLTKIKNTCIMYGGNRDLERSDSSMFRIRTGSAPFPAPYDSLLFSFSVRVLPFQP